MRTLRGVESVLREDYERERERQAKKPATFLEKRGSHRYGSRQGEEEKTLKGGGWKKEKILEGEISMLGTNAI
ncbi:hypothetical protein NDU88_004711 [Pleurodeles waltl]|uniref:Uncharacterized protein n=1 Tax=Pleurodeles waltl TaxID=8319 RepID=A0AAV7RH02_PLEWA|nr:hypothetical protein NDU88_004711 [Pleurodeles waltl]